MCPQGRGWVLGGGCQGCQQPPGAGRVEGLVPPEPWGSDPACAIQTTDVVVIFTAALANSSCVLQGDYCALGLS